MSVHSCNSLDLWHESLPCCTQGCITPFGQTYSGYLKSHTRRKNPEGFVLLKVHCVSRTVDLPSDISTAKRKKKYGGVLPSILQSLEHGDIEKTLSFFCGNFSPKELTVILKEQRGWERIVCVFEWMKSQEDYLPNVIHYNIVLRALGMAQKWDELRLYWIEMVRNGVLPTNNTYGMLIDVYGKSGLVKEAVMWIKHMRNRGVFPDEVTMNTAVRVLKDAGEYGRAEKLYKDWLSGQVGLDNLCLESMSDSDPISFKQFLSTELFKTGPAKVMGPLDIGPSFQKPRRTATYNTLIDLYGKAGRLEDAASAFAEMLKLGVPMDVITFNTMIHTCGSHGRLSEAESLLQIMEERRVAPDTKTYNIFFSLYADVGNIDAALKCYQKIREVGLSPDVVTYRAVLHMLCMRNMVLEAGVLIEEMDDDSVHVDEQSLPVVIKMYVNEGLLAQAKTLLEKQELVSGLSPNTYAAIMDVYAENGLWAEAEAVFLRKRQCKNVLEYNVMIKAYGKSKLYDKALSLFEGMKSQGTWPDGCSYNSLIQMLSGGDLVEQARDLLGEMRRAGFKPQCQTFSAVIASYVRLGQVSDAVCVFEEMTEAGVYPNEFIFGTLIDGFVETGRVAEALRYFRMMGECGIRANRIVLTSMIKAYGKTGCLEGGEKLYENMGSVDVVASNCMMKLYADFGMVSKAKSIFNSMTEKSLADEVSFVTMMHLFKSMGMVPDAVNVAEEMKRLGLLRNCSSFNEVMLCYAMNGQLRDCGNLLREMIERKILPDGGTFKILFTVLKKGGVVIEAVEQLKSSYQEGKPYARQAVTTCVFTVAGLHRDALESCKAFAKSLTGLEVYAYNSAIYAYGASGEIEMALNVFMKMQDEGLEPDIVTLINLAGCYGKAGMVEGVKRVHGQLKHGVIKPNESLFKAVMGAYESANREDLAELVNQEMHFAFDVQ